MAHPVIWPKKNFFYPIGNTPPVCFTQELAPEENAEILLLGCGDPRTRNILLLTFVADGVPVNHAWSIFYHFFLDQSSYDLLLAQCRTLIRSSSDMRTWRASKYGKYLRFCTEHSLVEIRRHWSLYLETDGLADKEKKALRESFTSGMKSVRESNRGSVITGLRAAGPLFLSILEESAKSYTKFWTSGITVSKSSQSTTAPHINPTFAYSLSGRTFNVHYGTDPILAFHLAPVLASIKDVQLPSTLSTQDLVELAMTQFSSWCSSFKSRISAGSAANIVIRFFVGESLAFCRALHTCKEGQITKTGICTYPWGGTQIDLDLVDYGPTSSSAAPLLFNVIDTSNLADHSGLLNLLIVTVPLLRRKPCSVIHTSTLLRADRDGPKTSGLSTMAFADIPTLSILLGITPSPHLWHFTTYSNKHELLASGLMSAQFYEPISWRFTSPVIPNSTIENEQLNHGPVRLICDPKKLAEFLLSVYLRMFAEENQLETLRNPGLAKLQIQNVVHYVRASFVAFLALVKERVEVDWPQAMHLFIDFVGHDHTLLVGLNNYQDLMCQMYLRNVHMPDVFTPAYLETARSPRDRFHGWKDIPPVVCVVLKVPRQQLKALEAMDADEILTPMLQCHSSSPTFHNIHPSIQPIFGDIEISRVGAESKVAIHEDPTGWSGSSPLIVAFYMPSWILTLAPSDTRIGLHFGSTPTTIRFISQLGTTLTIYSTSLVDALHVQVVRHRPNNIQEIDRLRNTPALSTSASGVRERNVTMKFDASGQKATTLEIRDDIADPKAAKALSEGARFDSASHFRELCPIFQLFFPYSWQSSKTRIARKSSYIEIESPIRPNFEDFLDLSLNPFAIARDHKLINLLNVHYLNLDVLPPLQLPAPAKDLQWLSTHIGMTLSEREKQVKNRSDQLARGTLVNLKESLACLFLKYSGLDDPKAWSNVFGLSNPTSGVGIYTLIFVNEMKLDLSSHTVVLDACVVPLIEKIMPRIFPMLQSLSQRGLVQVVTLDDETRAWRLLLPALAERCRTWKHTNACEYLKRGIPATLDGEDISPLCSCGKGKNLGLFGTNPEWQILRKEATRIAIGPLFTFSFMEKTMASMKDALDTPRDDRPSAASSSSSAPQCAKCSGPGKPTLLACSVCKTTKYCSRDCQKAHWKTHKKNCVQTA
ncbi:hypothetical protein BDZ97DRAFT_1762138 [Flammula alnicola]|nr:hypothetical protein BDZ97DRAFT_1762138 [Flammula alnicola]